jgi:hypothetical protein
MITIRNTNKNILNQLRQVLVQMDGDVYKKPLKVLNNSTIGQHVRHVIEFYTCLYSGIETNQIDYDSRQRDMQIETDKQYSLNILDKINSLLEIDHDDASLMLRTSFGQEFILVSTTFQRELTYLIEHTIHHLAIINIAINDSLPSIIVPKHFGVAFSTITYQESCSLSA